MAALLHLKDQVEVVRARLNKISAEAMNMVAELSTYSEILLLGIS